MAPKPAVELGSTSSSVTNAPWDGSASRFTDEQYKNAAAACDPDAGNTVKQQCFLPHHEPGGATNSNGVHAAAGRVSGLKGKSPASVGRAKSHLRAHYKQMGEDPPDSIAASLQLTREEFDAMEREGTCVNCLLDQHHTHGADLVHGDEHTHETFAAPRFTVGSSDSCPDDHQFAVLDAQEPSGDDPCEACFDDQALARQVADQLNAGKLQDPDDDEAMSEFIEAFGGKPKKNTRSDRRLKENKDVPPYEDGNTKQKNARKTSDAQLAQGEQVIESGVLDAPAPQFRGTLVVEGVRTGDGREFADDAITWADPPMPLRWQKVGNHGGDTDVTVRVGSITRVWRDGNKIMGEGYFDLGGPDDDDAHEAYRRFMAGNNNGISIDADDITDSDIEYVFPEPEEGEEGDLFMLLFAMPEAIIFHAGRIRGATLCDIPAFVEAEIFPIDSPEAMAAGAALLDSVHHTETVDEAWDGAAVEITLGELDVETARKFYTWVDPNVEGDARLGARLLHHDVEGRANLTGVSAALANLSFVPAHERRAAYEHLAQHLRDAGKEPQPYVSEDALVAHAWHDDYRPPRSWFENPGLGVLTPIIVTDKGRVYGHAAPWGDCHLGFKNECVAPPHEDYHSYFLTGETVCDDGTHVAVGQITAGIEHANLSYRASKAKEHYENTDAVVADVVVGNDAHGIWVAGAIRQSAQAARVGALRASGQVSPDWRRIGGQLRMVGLLTVNVSGYQVPRARTYVKDDTPLTLVSSGMFVVHKPEPTEDELNQRAVKWLRDSLVARVHPKE